MVPSELSTITAAIAAGQPLQAERLCRAALLERPHDGDLLLLLAVSLHSQRRLREALAFYGELTRLFPLSGLHWSNYAEGLAEAGELGEARRAYGEAIRRDPGNPAPKVRLGLLLIEQGDYPAARAVLLDACALDQVSTSLRIHAARACCLCQDVEGAARLLKPWRSWLPLGDDGMQYELAQVLTLKNDVPGAADLLEDLVARRPAHLEARLLLASVYERIN